MGKLVVLFLVTASLASIGSQRSYSENYDMIQRTNNTCYLENGIRGLCVNVLKCNPQVLAQVVDTEENEGPEFEECSYIDIDGKSYRGVCCPRQSPVQNDPVAPPTSQVSGPFRGRPGSNNGRYPITVIKVDWPYSALIPAVVHTVSSGSKTQFMFPFNPWSPELFPGFAPPPFPVAPPVGPKPAEVDNGDGEFQDDEGISGRFPTVEPEEDGHPIAGDEWPPRVPTHPPDHAAPTHPPDHAAPTHPPALFPHHPTHAPAPVPAPAPAPPHQTRPNPKPANPQPGLLPGFPLPPGWPWVTLPTPPSRPRPGVTAPQQPVTRPPPRPTPPSRPTPPPTSPQQPSCGAPRQIGLGFRIVGGKVAGKNAFRWMAGLFMNGRLFCGGSLIDHYHVLTAAHCLVGVSPHSLTIRLGDHDFRTETESKHATVGVSSITVHPAYNRQNNQNDVAIIRLSSKVSYTDVIQPICLDSSTSDHANEAVTVAGWGSLGWKQPTSPILYEITMRAWSNTECDRSFTSFFHRPGTIVNHMICAGTLGKDSCTGDSGGPLMIQQNGQWVQVGVVSWGIQCGSTQQPGVYTRVASFRQWIEQNRT